jgi:hypothetical protein
MSFKPCEPHYRRAHAPNRRYLPSDLNGNIMHNYFNDENPDNKVSHETYRKVIREMNIGFTLLGNEECEVCKTHQQHLKVVNQDHTEECELCVSFAAHKIRYNQARTMYRSDANKQRSQHEILASVDLMKVCVIPVMPFKVCVFTSRLVAFNLTFAELKPDNKTDAPDNKTDKKKDTRTNPTLAVLWHEALSGRDGEDIVSAYWSWLMEHRDATDITLYCDNCGAQNKQWALYTAFLFAVNCIVLKVNTITITYLEPGHTFMSADSMHHQCEKALRKKGLISDFSDFVTAIRAKVPTKVLSFNDFADWPNGVSRTKINSYTDRPLMANTVVAQFRRGHQTIFIKQKYDDILFQEYDLLRANFDLDDLPPPAKTTPRGVNKIKKDTIIQNLCPLMDQNRQVFWKNLPVKPVADLCNLKPRA